jgi:hypothetical protein
VTGGYATIGAASYRVGSLAGLITSYISAAGSTRSSTAKAMAATGNASAFAAATDSIMEGSEIGSVTIRIWNKIWLWARWWRS